MVYADVKLRQKITYLERLVGIYVRFLRYYSDASVVLDGKVVRVTYHKAKNGGWPFQSKEFPITDLNKQISHYRQKVRAAFKNRHNNTNWR